MDDDIIQTALDLTLGDTVTFAFANRRGTLTATVDEYTIEHEAAFEEPGGAKKKKKFGLAVESHTLRDQYPDADLPEFDPDRADFTLTKRLDDINADDPDADWSWDLDMLHGVEYTPDHPDGDRGHGTIGTVAELTHGKLVTHEV